MAARKTIPATKAQVPYGDQDWFQKPGKPATELTDTQIEFIEWLLMPKRMGTQEEWAGRHDVHFATLTKWKKHPLFRAEWEKRAARLNVSIERTQDVITAIYQAAVAGDVKAASLYLQYIQRFTPTKAVVVEDRSVKEMSDSELADLLASQADQLRARTTTTGDEDGTRQRSVG